MAAWGLEARLFWVVTERREEKCKQSQADEMVLRWEIGKLQGELKI